jgi:ureidoglycolate lyase
MKNFDPAEIAYVPTTGVRQTHQTELVAATAETLKGYGRLVETPETFPIEIVRWPAQGWRPVDENSGDQGGIAEGIFEFWWKGETLYARNNAVGDSYVFGWSNWPEEAATEGPALPRQRALIWRANYHPDGGQLFFPLHGESFVVPLALPGDDVTPDHFVAFWCDGRSSLYIHPNVWHGAVVPLDDHAELLDRQGRVHARVSVDFVKEFGCYLAVSTKPPPAYTATSCSSNSLSEPTDHGVGEINK